MRHEGQVLWDHAYGMGLMFSHGQNRSNSALFRGSSLLFPSTQVFHQIFARHTPDGEITNTIACEDKEAKETEDIPEEDQTFCEVCGRCDREDRLLLCDGCDNG